MCLPKILPRIVKGFQQMKVAPCQQWINDRGMAGKGRFPSKRNMKRGLSPEKGRTFIEWWSSRRDRFA
jgi:hypothetical protein